VSAPVSVTKAELEILRHLLGVGRRCGRKNYCARDVAPALEALVFKGLLTRDGTINQGCDRCYAVTKLGREFAASGGAA